MHAPPPLRDVQRRQLPSDDGGVCFLTAGRRCVCAVVVVGAVIPALSPQTATSPPYLFVALWAARRAPVQWYHVIQTPCSRTAADRCTGSQGRAHARVVARGQLRTCAHARLAPNDSRSTYWWQTCHTCFTAARLVNETAYFTKTYSGTESDPSTVLDKGGGGEGCSDDCAITGSVLVNLDVAALARRGPFLSGNIHEESQSKRAVWK